MAEFALSTDEVATICRNLAAQMGAVPDQIKEIRSSEIAQTDFGGPRYARLVQRYIATTQDIIPRLLAQYAEQGCDLARRIETTLGSYLAADTTAAASLANGAP